MEEILEIRKECETPLELLKSEAFSRYVEIYKSEFIKELKKREDSNLKEDVVHKIDYINSIDAKIYASILEGNPPYQGDELRNFKDAVQFLDGAFHHYRTKSYARFINLTMIWLITHQKLTNLKTKLQISRKTYQI